MEFEKLLRKHGKCCVTGKPMKDSKFLNFIQLHFRASWEFPIWGNIITGEEHMAVAYVHDDAIGLDGKLTGPIFWAVEFNEATTEIKYHEIKRCQVCGCTDEDCRQCIQKTGTACHWIIPQLCSACMDRVVTMYVVYDHPADFPASAVVRRHFILPGGTVLVDPDIFLEKPYVSMVIIKLQVLVPGLKNIGRDRDDDPVINSVYI